MLHLDMKLVMASHYAESATKKFGVVKKIKPHITIALLNETYYANYERLNMNLLKKLLEKFRPKSIMINPKTGESYGGPIPPPNDNLTRQLSDDEYMVLFTNAYPKIESLNICDIEYDWDHALSQAEAGFSDLTEKEHAQHRCREITREDYVTEDGRKAFRLRNRENNTIIKEVILPHGS